ncbi:MAG TPA: GNAT family N-acetyltransferase [Thermodesulfobacteriota bacterium]|nr:GNAT family N-acetyltransferase [Thermodesulfobacteriota bacterium]
MDPTERDRKIEEIKMVYPEKFAPEHKVFSHISPGNRIFIGTACGEPQHLVRSLIKYIEDNPKAFFDAEVLHVWTLGIAPYTDEKFKHNFRHDSFFIGHITRNAVNQGMADYTPIFLSEVPVLFARGLVPVEMALIQTSLPDDHGFMSLGVSVDIVKSATEKATWVIAQINSNMPRVHGDGFIHIEEVDFIMPFDEPLLEYRSETDDEIAQRIGKYVARLIQDGDTIQVGYGSLPNAILSNLEGKKHLGVHSELLTDGIVGLMKKKVIDNTQKSINRGKTIASFCMGKKETYGYIHDNPSFEFRTIDYTNNPLVIAQHHHMTAINSALEIDLTGQATAESLGKLFYSGIGGQADFMRGALLAPHGKTILTIQSTAENDTVSRIVPFLREGAGVTLHRADVHYVVSEYGIAYLHGKNIRERAIELISIAHPKFRSWLIEEAKKNSLIYKDQAFIPGERGLYPEFLETHKITKTGLNIFFRPVKISDEPILQGFLYSLSDNTIYRRFISSRKDMPHERVQRFVVIDYTKEISILAILQKDNTEEIVGLGQYSTNEGTHTAEVAFVVSDKYQNHGIGTELLSYLSFLAKRQGLLGFTAEVLWGNTAMLHLFEKMGFETEKRRDEGVVELTMMFK